MKETSSSPRQFVEQLAQDFPRQTLPGEDRDDFCGLWEAFDAGRLRTNYYTQDVWEDYPELSDFIAQLIQRERIVGQKAIHAYNKTHFSTLWHGSPAAIDGPLQPMQARWQDEKGRFYADGDPCICASDDPEVPIMRALLHDEHPSLKGLNNVPILMRKKDTHHRQFFFTSHEVFAALTDTEGSGYIYAIDRYDYPNRYDYEMRFYYNEPVLWESRKEYRLRRPVQPVIRIPVSIADLPPHLVILKGTQDQYRTFFKEMPTRSIPQLCEKIGMEAQLNGADWPLDHFPQLKSKRLPQEE